MPFLDPEQTVAFDRDGYLVLPGVFGEHEVAAMCADADFILELIVNSSPANELQSRRLDIRRKLDGTMYVRKIQPIVDLALALARFSADQRLLGPMSELMADEPVLMEEKLNHKQPVPSMETSRVPADDDRFPVHNDWAYYKANGYPKGIVLSALTIDECHDGNGPIRVFPGTHKAAHRSPAGSATAWRCRRGPSTPTEVSLCWRRRGR